jgi:hypothetical protein
MQKHKNMKKQGNMIPPKVNNPIVIDTKYSEEEESPNKVLKSMNVKMIN